MDIAKKLEYIKKVSFPTLNSWINGKSFPREGALQRIEEAYRVLSGRNVVSEADLKVKIKAVLKAKKPILSL